VNNNLCIPNVLINNPKIDRNNFVTTFLNLTAWIEQTIMSLCPILCSPSCVVGCRSHLVKFLVHCFHKLHDLCEKNHDLEIICHYSLFTQYTTVLLVLVANIDVFICQNKKNHQTNQMIVLHSDLSDQLFFCFYVNALDTVVGQQ
jgi:hypothetical protein